MTINEFMTNDHRGCDNQFAEVENAVSSGNFSVAKTMFGEFKKHLLDHFKMEEEVMFPEYCESGGGHCDPTNIMIMEHNQMKAILEDMEQSVNNEDIDGYLGLSENLMFTMQQHNMKEEQIMYNLADESLNSEEIITKMKEVID